jgi:hypothetical protein
MMAEPCLNKEGKWGVLGGRCPPKMAYPKFS